jgi:hypothetical protein
MAKSTFPVIHDESSIQDKIYIIRDQKVMLDLHLAEIYEVETRVLNQSVKRNIDRFPAYFMFKLTQEEWHQVSSSQFVMMKLPRNRTGKYLPLAFTEHGVTMLASILKSPKARKMNIAIVRAFIAYRKLLQGSRLAEQLIELKQKINDHDLQIAQIYEAIENLLNDQTGKSAWTNRQRIGFQRS